MHGRVKVRTSEEEKARKEKERQEKLKVFKNVMQKIQNKRKLDELDNELLELTGKMLLSNPDIYTLWNIRRDIIVIIRKNESQQTLQKLYDDELNLTEYCLKTNPKSYGAWHQREWVLLNRPDPDWNKELILCNTYLKLDERNFHTWDYRRFVVSQCKPSKDEFEFTTEKLYENFSNYSAWHYRSKLLTELYPDVKGGRPIQDSHHKHELKLVLNAAFTDPDDTSAWFYQRWLLGAVKNVTHPVVCTVSPSKTTVAFNQNVNKEFVKTKTKLYFNNILVYGDWYSCTKYQYDNLWILNHNVAVTQDLNVKVEYLADSGDNKVIKCEKYGPLKYVGKSGIRFQKDYSQPVVEELKTQLESCRELLAMEPDNKCTLLTTTVFLHCIDAKLYHEEVIANLHTLKHIDKLRSGYYDHLISKWSIEKQLTDDYNKNGLQLKIKFNEIIISLPHLQYYSYCHDVDLSNQSLSSKILPSLVMLAHCKILSLENNKLTTLKGFPDLELDQLNLKSNALDKKEVDLLQKKCKYNILF